MRKSRSTLVKSLMILSVVGISITVAILMVLWSNYVAKYKRDTSNAALTVIKICISNSENNIDETSSLVMDYIGNLPNRTVAVYDNGYNLQKVYSNEHSYVDLDIKNNLDLLNSLNTSDNGHMLIKINNQNKEVYWDWVKSEDGSRESLIIYSMLMDSINEFSFIFIISFILLILILILTASLYINYRNEYLSSMINLYKISSTYAEK